MQGALLVVWDKVVTGDKLHQFADLENTMGCAVVDHDR